MPEKVLCKIECENLSITEDESELFFTRVPVKCETFSVPTKAGYFVVDKVKHIPADVWGNKQPGAHAKLVCTFVVE